MSFSVGSWWALLCAVAVINIIAWLIAGAALRRRPDFAARRLQLVLSGAYVFGCAFRSFLPVYDIPRIGLVDTWLSSVIVGRSVATVAELCFAAQWALMLHESARATSSDLMRKASLVIVPLIALAEICSWHAVLTTNNIGHVIENSLWGISAALVVISMLMIEPRRTLHAVWCLAGVVFVAYIFLIDVPMYWSRWTVDEADRRAYLSLAQGLHDVATRRVVSFRWEDWQNEVDWMTLYFSVGVWASLSLIHARSNR